MALFRWPEKEQWGGANIGDRRVRCRLLLFPKRLNGEWRWLGVEKVTQEHMRWTQISPAFPRPITVRGWRDVEWAE